MYRHVTAPIDLAGPRQGGALVLAANGRLWLVRPSGTVRPFAPAYRYSTAYEDYIALTSESHRGCSFGHDSVYALRVGPSSGVMKVSAGAACCHDHRSRVTQRDCLR